jgi:hypothetical protein
MKFVLDYRIITKWLNSIDHPNNGGLSPTGSTEIAQRTRAWQELCQDVAELGNNDCNFKTCQWMQVVAHCNQSSYAF